jgi:hypothetical protein
LNVAIRARGRVAIVGFAAVASVSATQAEPMAKGMMHSRDNRLRRQYAPANSTLEIPKLELECSLGSRTRLLVGLHRS